MLSNGLFKVFIELKHLFIKFFAGVYQKLIVSELVIENIYGHIAFLLKGFTIKIFEKLINKAINLQEKVRWSPLVYQ